jgi:hypothetical protein
MSRESATPEQECVLHSVCDHHVFKTPVSVRDLAQILTDIDMTQMPKGASLHFTEKTAGGVCMSLLVDTNPVTAATQHRLLETSNSSEWPFIPEIQPFALLQSLAEATKHRKTDRWGLLEKRISCLVVGKPQHCDPPCVHRAAHYVLHCIKVADGY